MPTVNEIVRAIIADPAGMALQFPETPREEVSPERAQWDECIGGSTMEQALRDTYTLLHCGQASRALQGFHARPQDQRFYGDGDGPMPPSPQRQDDYGCELEREGRFYLDDAGELAFDPPAESGPTPPGVIQLGTNNSGRDTWHCRRCGSEQTGPSATCATCETTDELRTGSPVSRPDHYRVTASQCSCGFQARFRIWSGEPLADNASEVMRRHLADEPFDAFGVPHRYRVCERCRRSAACGEVAIADPSPFPGFSLLVGDGPTTHWEYRCWNCVRGL